ncbi:hypothetical protein [Streptococcus pseudoporcinus]|uniref:Uncharacterized protein n=1 Tax=Streptococcus pseudoporcinus TaxID=361101 RepID=A0A4U9XMA4_9STRE|nr:hypothetical protein [Streptococcus pseudoporcinus]VTS13491.1 Uncharacterised protein [Streptococcus pseudoporcinus]VUC69608.1 Uncharacterised protein [Streptococcus pseudoporcinus]VUC99943.1 Uncharacterised protein [Streptococcus pseudoporcinus]VUD00337.1 Uncharacterised protein [Streptococcus pseudoporcinus]
MILTFILFLLKALGVVKVSWFIVFVPFVIVLAMIISFIVFLLIMNYNAGRYVAKFEHDMRMREMDRNFQKAKSDYELHKKEFDEKMNRLKGGME